MKNEQETKLMLNLGCGDVYFEGWINIDISSKKADLLCDLKEPLPYKDNSVDIIYNEHFIEHITAREGSKFLKECYRVLKPGGIFRIATPDLKYILLKYFFIWKNQFWIKKYGYSWIKTKAEMVNIVFREWGHQYLYDKEELKRRLIEAGFNRISSKKLNQSKYQELRNRETRKDSKLILEAVK